MKLLILKILLLLGIISPSQVNLGAPTNFVITGTSTLQTNYADGSATSSIKAATSTFAGDVSIIGVTRLYGGLNASSSATSTYQAGINVATGCFSVNGTCVGGATGITSLGGLTSGTQTFTGQGLGISSAGTTHTFSASTSPFFGGITATGTIAFTNLSSGLTANTNGTLYGGIATGTISSSGGITTTASRSAVGGALAIDCTVATASAAGCLSTTDWSLFNSKALFSFTPTAYGNSTSTIIGFTGGLMSMASSTFSSTLNVSGLLSASSSLSVGGGTALGSTLSVTGLSTFAGFISTASSTFSSDLFVSGRYTSSSTLDVKDATVLIKKYPAFSIATSTTASTSSYFLGSAGTKETWNWAECRSSKNIVDVSFSNAGNLLNMLRASGTLSRFTFSTNNSFTLSSNRSLVASSSASFQLSCTVEIIQNL